MARVGVDIDGVIYDFADSLRTYLHVHKSWNMARCPDPIRWEFYLDWGMSAEEFVAVCHAAANSGWLFRHGEPTNDAVAQLNRLREAGHTIHFVTDRSFGFSGVPSKRSTLAWLEEHGIKYDTLTFASDKATVAYQLDIDYMIDDKPDNYDALVAVGVRAIMQARPWNRDARGRRMFTLEEFVDFVLADTETQADLQSVIAATDASVQAIAAVTATTSGEVRTVSSTGGEKGVKPARFDLIPAGPLWQVAELYGYGATKYADRNWECGYEWSKSFGAMMRHAWAFWNGEDRDVEEGGSQLSHLASVVFHAFALMEFMQTHPEFDNRSSTMRDREAATDVTISNWEREFVAGICETQKVRELLIPQPAPSTDWCDESCCRTT